MLASRDRGRNSNTHTTRYSTGSAPAPCACQVPVLCLCCGCGSPEGLELESGACRLSDRGTIQVARCEHTSLYTRQNTQGISTDHGPHSSLNITRPRSTRLDNVRAEVAWYVLDERKVPQPPLVQLGEQIFKGDRDLRCVAVLCGW